MTDLHKEKYAAFIRLVAETRGKADVVVISHPSIIGDNYDEIITNLDLLSEAGLALSIAGRENV